MSSASHNFSNQHQGLLQRRHFLRRCGALGSVAMLGTLTACASSGDNATASLPAHALRPLPRLQPGDVIGVIAPASAANGKAQDVAAWIASRGYVPLLYGSASAATDDYLSDSDSQRLHDLHAAFANPQVKAIFCLRGGYGSGRLLDRIDYDLLKKNAKIFVGYSDITALHIAITRRAGFITFHGPMLTSDFLRNKQEPTESSLFELLRGDIPRLTWLPHPDKFELQTIRAGIAQGRLMGGNLATIGATLGTPYDIDLQDAILFIEDSGEPPRKIDRLLTQLRLAGKFNSLRGVLIGDFSDINEPDDIEDKTLLNRQRIDTLWRQMLAPLNIPVLAGWQSGHGDPNLTLPLGASVTLDATNKRLRLDQQVTL